MSSENNSRIVSYSKVIIWISFTGIIITIFTFWLQGYIIPFGKIKPETIGVFGDFVGGFFGTTLTIAATLLIYATYESQKNELQQTKDHLYYQTFENTFFHLLTSLNKAKNSLNVDESAHVTMSSDRSFRRGTPLNNDSAFEFIVDDFNRYYELEHLSNLGVGTYTYFNKEYVYKQKDELLLKIPRENPKERTKEAFEIVYNRYKYSIEQYFRQIQQLLNYIEDLKSNNEDKKQFYVDILTGQLSQNELSLIYYASHYFNQLEDSCKNLEVFCALDFSKLVDEEKRTM